MTKKKSKTEKLSSWNSPMRTFLLNRITKLDNYKLKIKEGYPLRTDKELHDIINRYNDGLTFEEINAEQVKKSPVIKLKKPTFRKYIQDNLLPKSKGYKNVEKKRVAIFPNNVISHINFLYYFYQVADNKIIDALTNISEAVIFDEITYLEAILSFSTYDNMHAAIYHYICFDDVDVENAIKNALAKKPKEKAKVLKILERIDKKFDTSIKKEISNLINFLEEHKIHFIEIQDQ